MKMSWTPVNNDVYVAELSTIEAFEKKARRVVRCPKCRMGRTRLWLCNWASAVRDRENEVTHFVTRCKCGAELHVIND
jgi:hypothetical protein